MWRLWSSLLLLSALCGGVMLAATLYNHRNPATLQRIALQPVNQSDIDVQDLTTNTMQQFAAQADQLAQQLQWIDGGQSLLYLRNEFRFHTLSTLNTLNGQTQIVAPSSDAPTTPYSARVQTSSGKVGIVAGSLGANRTTIVPGVWVLDNHYKTAHFRNETAAGLTWLPDNSLLLLQVASSGNGYDLVQWWPAQNRSVKLASLSTLLVAEELNVSHDGRFVLTISEAQPFLFDLQTERRIPTPDFTQDLLMRSAQFSPTDNRIAYSGIFLGLVVEHPNGRRVQIEDNFTLRVRWSSDGVWLVYEKQTQNNNFALYMARADGSGDPQLIYGGSVVDFAPAPIIDLRPGMWPSLLIAFSGLIASVVMLRWR